MPNSVLHNGEWIPVSHTPSEIDALFAILPIYRFGSLTDSPPVLTTQGVAAGAVTVEIGGPNGTLAFLAGKRLIVPTKTLNFPLVADEVYYVYLQVTGNVPELISSTAVIDESHTVMFVGSVVVNSDGTSAAIDIAEQTRLGNYRLSRERKGGAIPVSTGDPTQPGTYNW